VIDFFAPLLGRLPARLQAEWHEPERMVGSKALCHHHSASFTTFYITILAADGTSSVNVAVPAGERLSDQTKN
jgi:hypothetical protein